MQSHGALLQLLRTRAGTGMPTGVRSCPVGCYADRVASPMNNKTIPACDYAVAFIDLLGQKEAMRERHLPDDHDRALQIIKDSVGKVISTQKQFETFYRAFTTHKMLYSQLPMGLQHQLPDLVPGELKWQRFSDGFVIYIPLVNGLVKAPDCRATYRHNNLISTL